MAANHSTLLSVTSVETLTWDPLKPDLLVDIYSPSVAANGHLVLFIHGGGWFGGDRTDYSPALFQCLLDAGYTIASPDYPLLPEAAFEMVLKCITAMGPWTENKVAEIYTRALKGGKVAVMGSSAGAHYAYLTRIAWRTLPAAMVGLSPPADLHMIPYKAGSRIPIDPRTDSEIIREATDFNRSALTGFPPSRNPGDSNRPRVLMTRRSFARENLADIFVLGFHKDEEGMWIWPEKGTASRQQIDKISPLYLAETMDFPPVYQLVGGQDFIFEHGTHALAFHNTLKKRGSLCEINVVAGKGHAFENSIRLGDKGEMECLLLLVEWLQSVLL